MNSETRIRQLLAELQQEIDQLQAKAEAAPIDLRAVLQTMPAEAIAEALYRSLDSHKLDRCQRFLNSYRQQDQGWRGIETDIQKLVPLPSFIIQNFVIGLAQRRYPQVHQPAELAQVIQDDYCVALDLSRKTDWFRAWAILQHGLNAAMVLENPPHSIHQFVEQAMRYGAGSRRRPEPARQEPPKDSPPQEPAAQEASQTNAQAHGQQRRQTAGTSQQRSSRKPGQGESRFNRTRESRPPAAIVLNLDWPTTLEELKLAYRRLAKQNHPDVGGDPEKFHRIQTAYQELLDQVG